MLPGFDAKPLRREFLSLFRRAMANGGAALARLSLGAGTVGNPVFQASTGAVARSAMGAAASGANADITSMSALVGAGLVPVGSVITFAGSTAPTGYLEMNGGTIGSASSGATARANADTEALYTHLWNNFSNSVLVIQTSAGAGTTRGASAAADFAANKRLPLHDTRGEFIRGWDNGRGVDSARGIGSTQTESIGPHTHDITPRVNIPGTGASGGWVYNFANTSSPQGSGATASNSGTENRPRNLAFMHCIKY